MIRGEASKLLIWGRQTLEQSSTYARPRNQRCEPRSLPGAPSAGRFDAVAKVWCWRVSGGEEPRLKMNGEKTMVHEMD
jgi:hypothetical protein